MSSPSSRRSSLKIHKTESRIGYGATSILTGVEPKKQKLPLWPEWNEIDVNAEKWEVGGKAKDPKAGKSPSAPALHGFEDPDPKFDLPHVLNTRIESWKRPAELYDKIPIIVDPENGLENFDIIEPNEHLQNCETMRWIISQIQTLWDLCKKDPKVSLNLSILTQEGDPSSNKAVAAGRTWRPWEHIYAINKIVKGPFIPVYNPYGKYAVRLYFMGCWRKVIVDDLIPVDENNRILLPQTAISGELWPLILTKALLKIFYLDFNSAGSATEFNDTNVISCLTGWVPEPLPLRFGHISEVWKFLKETLPKYQWAEDKAKTPQEDDQTNPQVQDNSETKEDASVTDKHNNSEAKSPKKGVKDSKAALSGKESKLDKHAKKDPKDKKGKSVIDEPPPEESFVPDFPETIVVASFTDLPLTKISAHTELADRRERLRKYNLNHDFSNPVWITCTRDIPIDPPPPPEKIPVWKTIRQRKKRSVPSDEPIEQEPPKPEQWVELKSPYIGYKSTSSLTPHPPSRLPSTRYSRMLSRPQTGIQGIVEVDERSLSSERSISESPTGTKSPTKDLNTEKGAESESSATNQNKKQSDKLLKTSAPKRQKSNDIPKEDAKQATLSVNKDQSVKKLSKDVSIVSDAKTSIQEEAKGPKNSKNTSILQSSGDDSLLGATQNTQNTQNTSAVPGINTTDATAQNESKVAEAETKTNETKNKLWMDFEDFFVCFKSILVYHKPACYKFNEKYSDLKQVVPQQKQDKKKDTSASQQQQPLIDEKSPRFLFVDNLNPIEIVVSLSSLSKWYEQKEAVSEKTGKSKKQDVSYSEHETMSVVETTRDYTPLQSGYLMAENYSWKSLVIGQPVLRIHTTATRASLLTLPPGRHVLKFMINAPIGYHVHLMSNSKFYFGDEEEIMPKLTDESCRFVDQATNIIKALSEAVKSFSDPAKQKSLLEQLSLSISPITEDYITTGHQNSLELGQLNETFNNALYETIKKVLGDQVDLEMAFAWRAFTNDHLSNDILGVLNKRPGTSSTSRGSAKKVDKKKSEATGKAEKGEKGEKGDKDKGDKNEKQDSTDERLEYWKTHVPNDVDHKSAVILQSYWRGYYTRQILDARSPGTQKNIDVTETLKRTWASVEASLQENALFLFRTMFKINPDIMSFYSFYKDEWNRISYIDYTGTYSEQIINSWFILFRETFFATEPVLLLPKLYCNLNNSVLRVIDNDTYNEIPKVFNKVSPYTYTKNRKGYTILAEARVLDQPTLPGRWKLRLIGSSPSLITPKGGKTEITSALEPKEFRDYYIPNDKKTILRYKVVVNEDHLASLQITTSKPDVYLKFSILDNDEEIYCVTGKGSAVIPAYIFLKDRESDTALPVSSRPGSKNSGKKTAGSNNTAKKSRSEPRSRSSSRHSIVQDIDEDDNKTHRYVVEATVLRNSWPLTPSQWNFINSIKETEILENKVFPKDRASSPTKESKMANQADKGAKGAKAKAPKAKPTTVSRPASSQFDTTKPHWILRVVSDPNNDDIDIKKDVDRQEEIRAMKRAWETEQPGRSVKAMQSRIEFLKTRMVKTDQDEEEKTDEDHLAESLQAGSQSMEKLAQAPIKHADSKQKVKVVPADEPKAKGVKQKKTVETKTIEPEPQAEAIQEEVLLNRPPTPPKPKAVLPPIDLSAFMKSTNQKIIKDDDLENLQAAMRKEEVERFTAFREQLNKLREEERKSRLTKKLKQIEECENLQSVLDDARKSIYDPREQFRQKYLESERKRLEELAAKEAAIAAAMKSETKDKKKGSAGKAKKK